MRKIFGRGDVYLGVCVSLRPSHLMWVPCQEHHCLPTLCFNVRFPFLVSHSPPPSACLFQQLGAMTLIGAIKIPSVPFGSLRLQYQHRYVL
jgi:hypothetical protein